MAIRVILNGKKAGLDWVRDAIYRARKQGKVEVRSTWEAGDMDRLIREASMEGCRRLLIGGGDGSIKEAVDAIHRLSTADKPELAVLPLGTANDFATACGIPTDPDAALHLAQTGTASAVDSVRANDEYFINVASGGFGAQVTTNTPVALKNFLGGGAYTLSGLVQALSFVPYHGEATLPDLKASGEIIAVALCNGRQAGGGQQLAPEAKINDGLLDLVALTHFPAEAAPQVINELRNPALNGQFVKRHRIPWIEWESPSQMPINLDGEPVQVKRIRFECLPGSIALVLPPDCPMLEK